MSEGKINSTKAMPGRGPLADTLKTQEEYDINKLNDTSAKK